MGAREKRTRQRMREYELKTWYIELEGNVPRVGSTQQSPFARLYIVTSRRREARVGAASGEVPSKSLSMDTSLPESSAY